MQFIVGGVLKGQQGVVGAGYGHEDLIELALGRTLVASLVGWITKTMVSVRAATSVWKMVSHRAGNPAAMLAMIQAPAAVTTNTAASGRDA